MGLRTRLVFDFLCYALPSLAAVPFGSSVPHGTVLFLNGFHFVSGHTDWEISANHYCSLNRPDMLQCIIYNTATEPVHLTGIEYIITAEAFEILGYEERQLWHSHVFEVKSGYLIEPGMPESVDHTIMADVLVGTYGKTFHTWRYDAINKTYPEGIPELVMGYTGDEQITPQFVTDRDELFEVNTTRVRESRADIESPEIIAGADSWKYGYILSVELKNETGTTAFGSNPPN